MKVIRRLDYHGIKPSLKLGKNYVFQSDFGGIVSLIILLIILYVSISFSKNMVIKIDPAIKSSLNFHDNEPTVDLKNFDIFMFLYDRSNNIYIDDPRIAYFEATIVKASELEQGGFDETDVSLDLESCSIEAVSPAYLQKYLKRLGGSKSTCVKKRQNHNETISGAWGKPEYDYMSIDFKKCSGKTPDGRPCKTKEEIEMVFKDAIVGVNIVDAVLHLEDYDDPHKKMIKSIHTFTSNQIYKEYVIDLSLGRIITDSGWLMDSKVEEPFLKVTGEREMTRMASDADGGSLVSFVVQMTNVEQVYDRTYDKLPDIIARTGFL